MGIYRPQETGIDRVHNSMEILVKGIEYTRKFESNSEWCPIVKYDLYQRIPYDITFDFNSDVYK